MLGLLEVLKLAMLTYFSVTNHVIIYIMYCKSDPRDCDFVNAF